MLKNLRNNNHGVIFVTVLIMIIVAMVLTVSVLSLNVSQIKSTEDELKYIQAKIIAEGAIAQMIANDFLGVGTGPVTYTEPLGNTTYSVDATIDSGGSGPPNSNSKPFVIDINF